MKLIGVECWADKYFFERLLNDKSLIRKESGDDAVINGVVIRSKGNFSIGIIDIDKDKKIPNDFVKIQANENTQIFKHNTNCQFLILIGPRQFEHWINEFLKFKDNKVEDFGFVSFVEFMKQSKSLKPENNERFRNLINFVFEKLNEVENHILKLKSQLEYIIEKKYQFDITAFLEI